MNSNLNPTTVLPSVIDVILEAVNLGHVDRSTLGPDTPLTEGGLGLDSVDILEIIVALEQKFGVAVKDPETGRKHFRTPGTVAQFISANAGTA